MPKEHTTSFEMGRKVIGPLGEAVYKDGPPRFYNPYALRYPRETPIQILISFQLIPLRSIPVVLPQVERRIRKDAVNGFFLKYRKQVEAIRIEHHAKFSAKCWFEFVHVRLRRFR